VQIETKTTTHHTLTLSGNELFEIRSYLCHFLDRLKPEDYVGSDPEEPARSWIGVIDDALGDIDHKRTIPQEYARCALE